MKNNKGITLIALIITIIVMLILVAVTVSVVINSNLIGTAQGAGENTKLAYGEEANIDGFNRIVNGEEVYYNNVEEYIDEITGNGAVTEFKIAQTPTYKFYIGGYTLLIDNNTTWQDCIGATNGIITGTTEYHGYWGNDVIFIYVNGIGGEVFNDYKEGVCTPPYGPSDTIGTSKILANLQYSYDPYITLGKRILADGDIANWEYVKQYAANNPNATDFLYGYFEEI